MKKIPGPVCVLIASLLFATGGLFIKLIPWQPLAINSARSVIALLVVFSYMKISGAPFKVNRGVLIGALCLCGTNVLYTFANKLTTAGNTIILQFTAPIFVLIWSFLFFKKKPVRDDIIACICVFSGVVVFFIDSISAGNMLGNALAVMSGMTYAGVFMMNDSKDASPLSSVILGYIFSIAAGVISLAKTDFSSTTVSGWLAIFALGFFQVGVAYVFFTEGIRTTASITASLLAAVEAIMNPLLVAIFMKEMLTPLSLAGAFIVLVSVTVYNLLKIRRGTKA